MLFAGKGLIASVCVCVRVCVEGSLNQAWILQDASTLSTQSELESHTCPDSHAG